MLHEIIQSKNLYLKWVDAKIGWGVFTDTAIKAGDVVERCYCLIDNRITTRNLDYVFETGNSGDLYHALGYGAIYNHSSEPNINWRVLDSKHNFIEFYAICDIDVNDELRHNYGSAYWDIWSTRKNIQLI